MTGLAVFDIDGTLTQTNSVDAECFLSALFVTFHINNGNSDWIDYSDVTDSAILDDMVVGARGRPPTPDERRAFVREFIVHLETARASTPERFREVPGAGAFLSHLDEIGWTVAIATGGWGDSAKLKLRHAGIPIDRWPIASADDDRSRVGIVRAAVRRTGVASDAMGPMVLFGDAPWDVDAARALEHPLIGVAAQPLASELIAAGAFAVIEDYVDRDRVIGVMRAAMNRQTRGERGTLRHV